MSPFHLSFRSVLKPHRVSHHHHHQHISRRTFVDTTINWVRDRGLDHVVEREKNLRPIINIKNLIKSEPSRSLPITILTQSRDALMIPTRPIEFVRQYPSIFEEFLPGGIAVQPHVRLTPQVLDIDAKEDFMYQTDSYKHQVADRLFRLLMLVRSNKLPLNIIELFKWDLGLPQDYERSIVPEYPDYFKIVVGKSGSRDLEMVCWSNELATSVMEKKAKRGYVKGMPIAFPMQFSRGFEMDKKLKKWIDEWQKLPYVSPYENAAHLSSQSDESDKWAVAVLHELLHILVPKKTDRENVFILGEYLGIRSRFKRALLHHPGILYVSSKLRTYTVVLREGYKRGAIIENHPLMDIRSQYIHLMNAMKEDGKTISSKEKNKGVKDSKGEDVEEEDDESEEGLEGELSDLSEAEVEHDDVDSDNDEEDEDNEEDEDERMTSIRKNDDGTRGRGARKSNFDVMTPPRNAERRRSGGRRAWKSEFDVKAPSRNAERGRSSGRRAWKPEFDVKAPSTNAERGRSGVQYPGKRGDEVSPETSGRTQADVRHNGPPNSRERSNRSRSRGRSFPDKKTCV